MNKVYIVEGWFGSDEWIERIFANENEALNYCEELWLTRRSRVNDRHHAAGLHKFDVVEHEVH